MQRFVDMICVQMWVQMVIYGERDAIWREHGAVMRRAAGKNARRDYETALFPARQPISLARAQEPLTGRSGVPDVARDINWQNVAPVAIQRA